MRSYKFILLVLGVFSLSSFTSNSPLTHYMKGMEHMKSKDLIHAIGAFTSAISLNPSYGEAYYQRAMAKDLFAAKIGYSNSEACIDYLAALNLGIKEAFTPLKNNCMNECFTMESALVEPDIVFCADLSSQIRYEIPADVEQLYNLIRLNLFNNKMVTVGDEIGTMPNLVELDLSSNRLKSINSKIGKLRELRELNLNKNYITQLPAEFGKLKNLESLYMRQNELSSFPPSAASLPNLKYLDLSFNKLTNLPAEIQQMTSLEHLLLVGNEIKKDEQAKIVASLPASCKVYFE